VQLKLSGRPDFKESSRTPNCKTLYNRNEDQMV
jgi:hypothetical protein